MSQIKLTQTKDINEKKEYVSKIDSSCFEIKIAIAQGQNLLVHKVLLKEGHGYCQPSSGLEEKQAPLLYSMT